MLPVTNHTKEYRQRRQEGLRRKEKFSVGAGVTVPAADSDHHLQQQNQESIQWLNTYARAQAAIKSIQESIDQQKHNYQLVHSAPTASYNLDDNIVQVANEANEAISTAKRLIREVYSKDLEGSNGELRMRMNAAKLLTLNLTKAAKEYQMVHSRLVEARVQGVDDGGEEERGSGDGASPDIHTRLTSQLIPTTHEAPLFSSHQISQMHELMQAVNQLFDEANQLTIEQGSMLDRIDQNVDIAVQKSLATRQQVHKTEHNQRHGFAKQATILLLIMNIIMLVLNSIKIYWKF